MRHVTRRIRLFCLPILCLAGVAVLAEPSPRGAAGPVSGLWGENGERWDPAGRLPDFSFAGYRRGEAELPVVPIVTDVRDFGAKGDSVTDDTQAFRDAIARTERGAIRIPPGRYLLNDVLNIRKPGIVLRGDGPDRTTLYFRRSLEEVRPNMTANSSGRPTSRYSWSGGFVSIAGSFQGEELTTLTAPARRGDTTIVVASTQNLRVGDEVDLRQNDEPDNSLASHLYAGQSGSMDNIGGKTQTTLTARIVSIGDDRLTLDRALRTDVELRWKPRLLRFRPTVTDVGIEDLRLEFPVTPYRGHFTEVGRNAIAMSGTAHCWVRNVAIDHADSGLFVGGRFCTIRDVTFNSDRPPSADNTGHHGIAFYGQDNLLTRFRFNQRFIHDITLSQEGTGNVISEGGGVDLSFDHHRRSPYANLITDVDIGKGTRPWRSGGGAALGRHTAAWATFWNLRSAQPLNWPPNNFGPDLMNLVGLPTTQPARLDPEGRWFEPAPDGDAIQPANLHLAQRARRLAAMPK